eukprot:CAMPEP_0115841480 /NCGR_PEP_ID=MMETSP0287-20121206/7310_1 /TAXON_ID=412157 /ORGANISM="Chrysochromulina rotalis, Strain UIO044" /LENGTH=42 /DNA_ID= /DNA_START= /DNA_END= /DNA_ORIENTATION=
MVVAESIAAATMEEEAVEMIPAHGEAERWPLVYAPGDGRGRA